MTNESNEEKLEFFEYSTGIQKFGRMCGGDGMMAIRFF